MKVEEITDKRLVDISIKFKKKLKNNLKILAVFGSRARGDYKEFSDYDFLIVLEKKNNEVIKNIRDIEVEFLNKYDILSSALIYNEEEWEMRKKIPIGVNIMNEGVFL